MKRHLVLLTLCIAATLTYAQKYDNWEEAYQSIYMTDDEADENREDDYELLWQLAEHPLDLNTASRDELEQLPFLSDQQVMDLLEYRDRYGCFRSMGELRMVASLDYQQITLLPYFTFAGEQPTTKEKTFPTIEKLLEYGKHTLTATGHIPFYERKGDQNGYLGYKYKHWLKYEFTQSDYVKLGVLGAQDAGEPFMANRNSWGYDVYSYYLQVRKWGRVKNLVVGKYKASAGLGLLLGQSFSLGKTALLQNLGRQTNTLRAHGSRSEADYFQGIGATVQLTKPLSLTGFVSYRPIDATLNNDGSASTLVTSGYHRTENEIGKKYNTHLTTAGGSLEYKNGGLQLGANLVYTHLDRTLQPNTQTLYRRHYAQGNNFINTSLNYAYTHPRFTLSGETALDRDGHIATLNTASYTPSQSFSLVALQRFYSYKYSSLHGHSFSDGGRVQNESGGYLGFRWTPLRHWHLTSYVDYAYAPWARYLISQSSHSWDLFAQLNYHPHQWNVELRYRGRFRQRDNEEKTALIANNIHRGRLVVNYERPEGWTFKAQADVARTFYQQAEMGWMVSQQTAYTHRLFKAQLTAGYFHTDSYATRLYIYERQLTGNFSFPSYFGEGLHLALTAQVHINSRLLAAARLSYTDYFDRSSIGTGLQQIDASHLTDLDLQLRWKF